MIYGTPPEDFADALRTLRDKYGHEPLVDPDSATAVANLYPRFSTEEVAERIGVEPPGDGPTPEEMQARIEELKQ